MYLIFIAMIAMQMSKEVLSAFGYMNEKLADNNITATNKNTATLANLATKAGEQKEKYDRRRRKRQVNPCSSALPVLRSE